MNLFKSNFWVRLVTVVLFAALTLLSGCATNPKTAFYSFNANGGNDKWVETVELLDGKFGTENQTFWEVYFRTDKREASQGAGIGGVYPIPETLYLKWRIRDTGEILEKTVNFKGILPKDLNKQTITFLFEGKDLYVYLVTDKYDRNNLPKTKTWLSSRINLITYEIYPTNKLPKELQE
jgi:hypothetical protein